MIQTGSDNLDNNQPRYPCPCCKYDCENEKCILCSYCQNWFHQHCAKLSDKRFEILGKSPSLQYKCKFCKCKKGKCSQCNKLVQTQCLDKMIYCISCKDWYCHGCLTLSPSEIKSFMTTDLPYFCRECSEDYYCPVCKDICRDKCIFCTQCEQFLHAKCSKLSRGQLRSLKNNYLCHICMKENLPVNAVSKPDQSAPNLQITTSPAITTNGTQNGSKSYCESEVLDAGCGLCIECDTECLSCDNCADLQRVCGLCLSCKNVDICDYKKILAAYESQNKLFVMHVNIRSLDTNKKRLKDLLYKSDVNPDVIAISETQLNDDYNLAKTDIDGYHPLVYKHSVTGDSDYGGVGLYITKNLSYDSRPDLAFDFDGCETKFIELQTKQVNRKNVIIGAIYRHPHNNHEAFYTNIGMLMKKITKKYSVILCGDVNINTASKNRASTAKDYKNLLLSYGCVNLINKYTRIQTDINGLTTKTIIDHIITNLDTNQAESGVITYHVSDHLPIFSMFDMNIKRQRLQTHVTKRFYNKSCKPQFIDTLKESLQNTFENTPNVFDNPDLALQKLVSEIQLAEGRAFPLKTLSRKKAKRRRRSWITSGILKSIDHRDKLFREQLGKNDAQLSSDYRKYRNKVTRIIEKAKDMDFLKSFQSIVDNPKKVWCKINSKFLHKKHCGSALPSEIIVGQEHITDQSEIANKLNEHFVNKAHILASKLPNSDISVLDSMKPRNENSITSWDYFLVQEILDIIKNDICINKSSGFDNVHAVLIKWSAEVIAPILVKIFNRCCELGEYPSCLKTAKVTALHKGSDRSSVDNYRSISVLTHINKIFEKLLHARLNDFITKHQILENNQYGFRKKHSTSHGITHLHETILESIEKKKVCVALFIDLKSAFDTIDHQILEQKLDHYGVRGKALKLLSSYLKNRKQFIKAGDIESAILLVLCGVPQGSVLGPLLFIIYINDIVTCSELGTLLFADDAVLTTSHDSLKYLERKFNAEIRKMHRWFITNKLTLNLKKTKFMIFSTKRKKKAKENKFRININRYCIKQVSEMKYLGVILDNKLNWHNHIQFLCTKLAKAAGIIYKIRNRAPQSVLKLLYHSLVGTYLRYGIISWGSAKTTALSKLRSLQNKVVHYITQSSQAINLTTKYAKLDILMLDEIYMLEVSKFMYKSASLSLPSSFNEYFMNINHQHNTRAKVNADLIFPRPRTNLGKQSIKIMGVKVWNEIPTDIRNSTTLNSFCTQIKSYITQNRL